VTGRPPKRGRTTHELAALAGVASSTLKLHARAGAPMPRRKADVMKWLPAYHAWREARRRPAGAPRAAAHHVEELRVTIERKRLLATLTKIAVAEKMGKLVPRDEVVTSRSVAILTVKNRLFTMVKKFAARFGPLIGPNGEALVEGDLLAEVTETCLALSRSMDPRDHGIPWPPQDGEDAPTATTHRTHDVVTGTARPADAEDLTDPLANEAGITTWNENEETNA
jgi:hypothetical protein